MMATATDDNAKPVNHEDLTEERREYLFKLPQSFERYFQFHLKESADIAILHLLFNICVVVFPSAFLLFALKNPPVWLGILHVAITYGLFLQRFVLTLHFASHQALFEKGTTLQRVFNIFLQYIVCPFFGIPSGTYHLHHVVMHHIENNVMPYDVSSTMCYQRNNFYHFLCYWVRFTFAIWFQLPYYAYRRRRYSLLVNNVVAQQFYLFAMYSLYQWKPTATLWVVIIPFFITSVALMFGNWCQHILIDPKRYNNSYALTYNLINTPMNKLTYNDGYHVVHHLYSSLHWSKLPEYFLANREKFFQNDALTFQGLDYVGVGVLLFLGRYETLASHYVHLGPPDTKKSVKELAALFQEWLQPIEAPAADDSKPPPKKA